MSQKFTLLYVDDEESNLRIFKDTFRRRYNIFTAKSAKEGIKILEGNNIDLVLSDQRMPEMTGAEFLKYTLDKFPEPNRILITGYSDLNAIENAINHARIFQYIHKPWDEKKLIHVIDNALHLYHLEQENKRQKEEIIKEKERAEESDRLKTEFLNNMSHEVRTPMNGMIGFSNLLEDPNLEQSKRKNYIKIIQQSAEQLLKIIEDILEIYTLGTNQAKIDEVELSLNHFLNDKYTFFNEKTSDKQLAFYMKKGLSDDKCKIIIDEIILNKIFNNLIENAIKYTNEGFIEIGYYIEDNKLILYVKDTGIGISPDNYEAIFSPFSQVEKELTKKTGGLGLGLAIVKENTELLGGKIEIESSLGEGTTFFVKLPYKPANEVKIKHQKLKKEFYFSDLSLLIAEDEDINYIFLNALLKNKFKSIIRAKNGKEVIDLIEKNTKFDLILMDLKMPLVDGFEATKFVKENSPETMVIAVSAYVLNEDKEKAFNAGCSGFIEKPVKKDKLIENLKYFISKFN